MRVVYLSLSFLWIIVLSFIGFSPHNSYAATDDTTCWVKDDCDDAGNIDAFNCLRHKIENGYNKKVQRSCVDRIIINEKITRITLTKPLVIDNDRDGDCEGNSPLCGDDWALILNGNSTEIDVQGIPEDCAVTIKSHLVKLTGLNFLATSAQVEGNKVVCDEGEDNELDVTINGREPGPSEEPPPNEPPPNEPPPQEPTPPAPPTALAAELTGISPDFEVQLTWTDNSNDETGFRVERNTLAEGETDCGTFSSLKSVGANSHEAGDDSVAPGNIYCYRVFAVKNTLSSAQPSNVVQIDVPDEPPTPPTAPPTPTELTATAVDDESIQLAWAFDDTADVVGFRLERGDEACAEDSFAQVALLPKDAREYTDTGLNAETTYCYRLQAYVVAPASASSDYSETANAQTLEDNGLPPVDPNDVDGDGILNDLDNCPNVSNSAQEDSDGDGAGDVCDTDEDEDNDGVSNDVDNCPDVANAGQEDADGDNIGDVCDNQDDADLDGDTVPNASDNCPQVANTDQTDEDEDGVGDACDLVPSTNTPTGGCGLSPTGTDKGSFWIWIMLGAFIPIGKFFHKRA
jgi:hypothetical protein